MEYLIISYVLTAVVITAYVAVIVKRTRQVERALQEEN